jgi:hypothetical protein
MPVYLPTDEQLDPLEQADLEEDMLTDDADEEVPVTELAQQDLSTPHDLDPELLEEMKRALVDDQLVVEENIVRPKTELIREEILNRPLDPANGDLWDDDGTI